MRPVILATATLAFALCAAAPLSAGEKSIRDMVGDAIGDFFKGRQLEKVEKVEPPANPYDKALFEGYLTLSRTEYNEGDYRDSDVFARRAEAAARGETSGPEAISARDLPVQLLNVAANQRRRLVVAQILGAREAIPDQAAEAQLAFDCWMQEQEEDFQIDDIADCIERFDLAMERIEVVIDPTPIPEPTVKLPRLVLEVFFDFDSAEVTTEAKKNIAAFAAWVPSYKSPVVSVVGNADQSGGVNYNFELSQRRADAVARELEALGVTVEGVFARGDQVPVIDRIDRAPERINRRVLMIVRES